MSAPDNRPTNLEEIIAQACTKAIAALMPPGKYPLDTTIIDEAVAAVIALLPGEPSAELIQMALQNGKPQQAASYNGFKAAVQQTRRNLIGEQLGDSNSPRGDTEPLSNQVMPEAPASGEEQ
jgi:hypothetical protein